MEDYKRKFDQLLGVVKEFYPSMSDYQKEKFEGICPELAESEDEKIRKEIIAYLDVQDAISSRKDEDFKIWIAWLEKQKSIKTAIEAWKEMRNEVFAQASGNRHEQNVSDEHSKIFSLSDINEIFEKISESVVEQKSFEWSEENEKLLKLTLENLKELEDEYGESYGRVGNCISWLKSLKPQPKQEWSEEDEGNMIDLLEYLEINLNECIRKDEIISWLKSLKPQQHWKPSEQELAALRTAISVLTEERKFPLAAGHLQDILSRFEYC